MQIVLVLFGLLACVDYNEAASQYKIVCYYDTESENSTRLDYRNLKLSNLVKNKPSPLTNCSHLVIGYATVNLATNKLELPKGSFADYISDLKSIETSIGSEPLKVYLSIGGDTDGDVDDAAKYLALLTNSNSRRTFVDSVKSSISDLDLDGLDVAWLFPTIRPDNGRRKRRGIGFNGHVSGGFGFNGGVNVGYNNNNRNKASSAVKDGFTTLIRELKKALTDLEISVTVLPNVDSKEYFDVKAISGLTEFVNLAVYEMNSPERNPSEANNASPLYGTKDNNKDRNADRLIQYWLDNGASSNKLVMGVTPGAYTWKLDKDKNADTDGVPPLKAEGQGLGLLLSHTSGYLLYEEICSIVKNDFDNDYNDDNGVVYAYAPYMWASYEDPTTLKQKAEYTKKKQLGGMAIMTIAEDDTVALCNRDDRFPLLKAVKEGLTE